MMQTAANAGRKAILAKVSHALVGLTLLLKGLDKAEHFSSHPFTVVFLFFAGAFIVMGTVFHQQLENKISNFTALFHFAEGLALILSGVALLQKSSRMPFFLFFIGAVYLGLGAFEFFTSAAEKKKLRPLLLTVMGIVFLVAAAVFMAFNFFNSGNSWAYITTGVIAVMGVFILTIRKHKQN